MRKSILVGLILVLSVTLCSADLETSLTPVIIVEDSMSILSDYVVHDPILILSDTDFETQGWPGNGSAADPYVIEGLWIDAQYDITSIKIWDSTVNYTIRNCHVEASTQNRYGPPASAVGAIGGIVICTIIVVSSLRSEGLLSVTRSVTG